MITGPATASTTIRTTTSSQTGFGRGRSAAWLMSRYIYRKPSRAASPASSIQMTRAMATVSRNRHMMPRYMPNSSLMLSHWSEMAITEAVPNSSTDQTMVAVRKPPIRTDGGSDRLLIRISRPE